MQLRGLSHPGGLAVTGPVLLKTFTPLVCFDSLSLCLSEVEQTNRTT